MNLPLLIKTLTRTQYTASKAKRLIYGLICTDDSRIFMLNKVCKIEKVNKNSFEISSYFN